MEHEVLDAARRRSQALVARDPGALRALHHPALTWTTHRGEIKDRDAYIAGNTQGGLVWRAQRLEDPHVTVVGDTAILTAVVYDEFERGGEPHSHRMHLSQTWVRDASGWVCLAAHAGPVVRP
jgi:hypothetical protein